jgi:hypothetical protein
MATNAFLKDFLVMRKSLTPAGISKEAHIPTPVQKKKRGMPKMSEEKETLNTTLQTIKEEKPPKKVVICYLQEKANEFTVEKMT